MEANQEVNLVELLDMPDIFGQEGVVDAQVQVQGEVEKSMEGERENDNQSCAAPSGCGKLRKRKACDSQYARQNPVLVSMLNRGAEQVCITLEDDCENNQLSSGHDECEKSGPVEKRQRLAEIENPEGQQNLEDSSQGGNESEVVHPTPSLNQPTVEINPHEIMGSGGPYRGFNVRVTSEVFNHLVANSRYFPSEIEDVRKKLKKCVSVPIDEKRFGVYVPLPLFTLMQKRLVE